VSAVGFTRPLIFADRRRLTTRRAIRSLGRHRHRQLLAHLLAVALFVLSLWPWPWSSPTGSYKHTMNVSCEARTSLPHSYCPLRCADDVSSLSVVGRTQQQPRRQCGDYRGQSIDRHRPPVPPSVHRRRRQYHCRHRDVGLLIIASSPTPIVAPARRNRA
jgi:hypothetical protein